MRPGQYLAAAKLSYALPETVEAMRTGWINGFQSIATASGLSAAVQAALLVFFKDESNFDQPKSTAQRITLLFTYIGIISSISATICTSILTSEFGDMPVRAARDPCIQSRRACDEFAGKDWQLLGIFGLRRSAYLIACHMFISALLASLCTVASIATYVISQEDPSMRVVVSVGAGLSILPLAHFFTQRGNVISVDRPPSEDIEMM